MIENLQGKQEQRALLLLPPHPYPSSKGKGRKQKIEVGFLSLRGGIKDGVYIPIFSKISLCTLGILCSPFISINL